MYITRVMPDLLTFSHGIAAVDTSTGKVIGTAIVPDEILEDGFDINSNYVIRTWDRMKPARRSGDTQMWRWMARGCDPIEQRLGPGVPFRLENYPTYEVRRRQNAFEVEEWCRKTYGDAAWEDE